MYTIESELGQVRFPSQLLCIYVVTMCERGTACAHALVAVYSDFGDRLALCCLAARHLSCHGHKRHACCLLQTASSELLSADLSGRGTNILATEV